MVKISAVLTPLAVLIAGAVISHEVRLAQVEASRFTDSEGAEMERRIYKSLPPVWLRERLDKLEAEQDDHDKRIRELEKKVK